MEVRYAYGQGTYKQYILRREGKIDKFFIWGHLNPDNLVIKDEDNSKWDMYTPIDIEQEKDLITLLFTKDIQIGDRK